MNTELDAALTQLAKLAGAITAQVGYADPENPCDCAICREVTVADNLLAVYGKTRIYPETEQ